MQAHKIRFGQNLLTPLAYRTIERVLCELDQCGEVIPDTVVTTLDAPAPTPTLNYIAGSSCC